MNRYAKKNGNNGQVLIEVIVALGVVSVSFTGILGLLGTSVGLSRTISNEYVGTYLAAEGIEVVKNIIDENYFRGWAFNAFGETSVLNGTYGMDYLTTSDPNTAHNPGDNLYLDTASSRYLYASVPGSSMVRTTFKREITVRNIDTPEMVAVEVTSRVTWTGKGGNFEVTVGDRFTNWWQ